MHHAEKVSLICARTNNEAMNAWMPRYNRKTDSQSVSPLDRWTGQKTGNSNESHMDGVVKIYHHTHAYKERTSNNHLKFKRNANATLHLSVEIERLLQS